MLGEISLRDVDLTAAANASPATDRIEIDAGRARGFEQARAFGELAPLSGGCENDAMGHPVSAREKRHPEGAAMSRPETLDSLTLASRGDMRDARPARNRDVTPGSPGRRALRTARRCVSYSFQSFGAAAASFSPGSSPQGTGSPRRHSAR